MAPKKLAQRVGELARHSGHDLTMFMGMTSKPEGAHCTGKVRGIFFFSFNGRTL